MVKIFLEIVICILAAYGFISMVYDTVMSVRNKMDYNNSMIKLILVVKNQGNIIEGVMRNVLSRDFLRKLMPGGKLTIIDMGSKDDTLDILRKLEKDYECLDVLKKSEKDTVFKRFEEQEDKESGFDYLKKKGLN
jgi:hypothetical protein